jgi:hypothetical protein
MANKYLPHLHILPEDDANRQVVNALLLGLGADTSRVKVFGPARGWSHVLEAFERDHEPGMRQYPERFVALVIDFDGDPERLQLAKLKIPPDLANRVFIFGSFDEPECLKPLFGSFDQIGERLGIECRHGLANVWNHPQLAINLPEVRRFQAVVRNRIV